MKCCACREVNLLPAMTKNGVMVNYCPECKGIWLGKGTLFLFSKSPKFLNWKLDEAINSTEVKPSSRVNPRTLKPLVELSVMDGLLVIDYCLDSGGVFLDKGELEKIAQSKKIPLTIFLDRNTQPDAQTGKASISIRLPNLGLTSAGTLFILYFLLGLVLITIAILDILPPGIVLFIGIAIASWQFFISPYVLDFVLGTFYQAKWISKDELPEHLKDFLERVCQKHKIKLPRLALISDGSPNAFTYGHKPNNARLVLTSGIVKLLEPEELEAVVAHEVGHIVHWDMLVMTVAYVVPLVFYYIYRYLMERGGGGRSRLVAAILAYIFYLISEYLVLWFSRIREYFADRFSGETINNPNTLASALVKIGYGMAGKERSKDSPDSSDKRKSELESIKAMGIFDPGSARNLAVVTFIPGSMGGEIDEENLKGVMKWDLWNPWAKYYEIQSTHPLIAKRLIALSRQAEAKGYFPYLRFNERKPESYWDEFLVDLLVTLLPGLVFVTGMIGYAFTQSISFLAGCLITLGLTYFLQVLFSYRHSFFPELNISSMLKKVKVSGVRPVPCTLKGKVIGRGIPGLIWSEDFILQDETGIIFLDYQQPLSVWNFLFGLSWSSGWIGKEVKVTGWYRRAPAPYIEIKSMECGDKKATCYVYHMKMAWSIILILAGLVLPCVYA